MICDYLSFNGLTTSAPLSRLSTSLMSNAVLPFNKVEKPPSVFDKIRLAEHWRANVAPSVNKGEFSESNAKTSLYWESESVSSLSSIWSSRPVSNNGLLLMKQRQRQLLGYGVMMPALFFFFYLHQCKRLSSVPLLPRDVHCCIGVCQTQWRSVKLFAMFPKPTLWHNPDLSPEADSHIPWRPIGHIEECQVQAAAAAAAVGRGGERTSNRT